MFCSKCGKELPTNAKFCSWCGSLQKKSDETITKEIATKVSGKVNNKFNKLKIVGSIIIVLTIAAVCVAKSQYV